MSAKPTPEELTAYVLGALDATARARVEAAVAADPALAAEVTKLRRTAGYVAANLGRDPELRLSPDRRAALEAALRKRAAAEPESRPAWWAPILRSYVMGPLAAAALVILVVWVGGRPTATTPVAEQAERMVAVPASPPPPQAREPEPAAPEPPVAQKVTRPQAPEFDKADAALRGGGAPAPKPAAPAAALEREADFAVAEEPKREVANAPAAPPAEARGVAAASSEADVLSESAPAPAAAEPPAKALQRAAKSVAVKTAPHVNVSAKGVAADTTGLAARLERLVGITLKADLGEIFVEIELAKEGPACAVVGSRKRGAATPPRMWRRESACDSAALALAAEDVFLKLFDQSELR